MKKKIKPPFALRAISWLFPRVEKLTPWLAQRWFVRIFFTPARYKVPYGEQAMFDQAVTYNLDYQGKRVQVYQWGEGRPVLCIHGWMGRGGQFRKFIPVLNAAGYQVVAFDAIGHGRSQGKRSHLLKFVDIASMLEQRYGGFESIIGHSLGGVAGMLAIRQGLSTDKLVMISSPTLGYKIIDEIMYRVNASPACGEYLNKYFIEKFGKPFEEFSASFIARDLRPIDLLLIHDVDDKEVDIENPKALLNVYSNARLVTTSGLGHTRILKDDTVVKTCLQFLTQSEPELAT